MFPAKVAGASCSRKPEPGTGPAREQDAPATLAGITRSGSDAAFFLNFGRVSPSFAFAILLI